MEIKFHFSMALHKIETFSPKTEKIMSRNAVSVTRKMRNYGLHIGVFNTLKYRVKNGVFREIIVQNPNFSTLSTGLSTGCG